MTTYIISFDEKPHSVVVVYINSGVKRINVSHEFFRKILTHTYVNLTTEEIVL